MKGLKEYAPPGYSTPSAPPSSRFPALAGLDVDAASLLQGLRLGVVGLGSVGGLTADHLARLAPHSLKLVDRGVYSPTSQWTNGGLEPGLAGRPKARHLAKRLKAVSPSTKVFALNGEYQDLPLGALFDGGMDAVLLAGDNIVSEIEVGQDCMRFGVPLIHASVHGETLTAHCRVYSMRPGADGPCPACGLSGREWAVAGRDAQFSCEPGGRAVRRPHPDRPPTRSLSFLCAQAATFAVGALVRTTLGIGDTAGDVCLEYQGYTHRSTATPLERNPDCPCEHLPWTLRELPGPLAGRAPGMLLDFIDEDFHGATVSVEGYRFAQSGICGCSEPYPLNRFLKPARTGPRCRRCRELVRPHPLRTTHHLPGEWLEPYAGRQLRGLGAFSVRSVLVRRNGRAVLIKGGTHG